jgi:predicted AlkP superfamily pyrophosphatase or phosphodiesterase
MLKRLTFNCTFIFLSLLLLAGCNQPVKNKPFRTPKLVIGIVVDQMRYDYLFKYYNKYGNGGFKRLLKEGFVCNDAEYNYVPTYTAPGHTSIYTGTTPCVHGMIANDWYDRKVGRMIYCTDDTAMKTVGSTSQAGMMSPKREMVTTIGDQLKLSDNGQSKVIGISEKDRAAILPAGHSANAAYWLDDLSGNWITSTYYMKDLPEWIKKFNSEGRVKKYLGQMWTTLLPINEYTESLKDDNPYEGVFKGEANPVFPHNLPALMSQNGGYGLIKTTPFGNDITTDFAIEAIKNERLGEGKYTDMLAISFSSTDYVGHMYGTDAIETEDTYLRLDKDLNRLLSFLDDYIGKNNVLIFLTADHGAAINPQELEDKNISAGSLESSEISSKIKVFLVQKYGSDLLTEFENQQCYLDKNKIADKGLNLDTIEKEVAIVASHCNGVERAIPAYKMNEGNDYIIQKLRNGYMASRSGDVIINLQPQYILYGKTGTTHGSPYIYDSHVPLIFYGCSVSKGATAKEEPITNIAPTICYLLGISYPDGCTGHPISILSQ